MDQYPRAVREGNQATGAIGRSVTFSGRPGVKQGNWRERMERMGMGGEEDGSLLGAVAAAITPALAQT